ncbi:MAG: arginine--tRNA ligase, partial [Proteobacteria bacterium]|nr:arginine--tRNA ligase [Pseudomonadota bacterium]
MKFHKAAETNPALEDEARQAFLKLERGDQAMIALWKKCVDISLREFSRSYSRLQVHFDHIWGESYYKEQLTPLLNDLRQRGLLIESEGAWIVELPGIATPALIQKKDGTTLYLTRDIAGAIDRYQRFQFSKHFYIVSEQQRLHFQQLFGILEAMGFDWAKRCAHLSFGTVLFGSEKMSTREGRVILLDDLLNEAKALALQECTQKNPELPQKEEV